MLVFLLLVTKGSEPPWIGIGSIYLFLWGLNIHYRYLDTCSTPIPCPHSSEKYKEGKEPDRRLLLLCNCNREISMREQLIPKWNFQHSCISISSQTTEEGKKTGCCTAPKNSDNCAVPKSFTTSSSVFSSLTQSLSQWVSCAPILCGGNYVFFFFFAT